MVHFKWLNLQVVYDSQGKYSLVPVNGELFTIRSATPTSSGPFDLVYVMPEYWGVKTVGGKMRIVDEKKKVVRLLIPVRKGL